MVVDTDWWVTAWQSAPAHVREPSAPVDAVENTAQDAADDWTVDAAENVPIGGTTASDAAAADAAPVVSARPRKARPRPIWHAASAPRNRDPRQERAGQADATVERSDLERLGVRIRGMAADLAASTCEWLRLIEQFDRRKGWAGVGVASCAAWLSWACSVSPATAREYLRVARSLPLLPLITAAFAVGAHG